MVIYSILIFLIIIIILLIFSIAYLQKLHYDERKGLYRIINNETVTETDTKPAKVSNFIKNKMNKRIKGGE